MLEILLCCKRSSKPEPISVVICRKFVVILFVSITLTVLVILSIGVNNDTPTITRKYSSMDKFPVPGTINNEYVNQPTYDNSSNSWKGSFSPDNLSFIISGDRNKTQNQGDIIKLDLGFEIMDTDHNATEDGYVRFSISMHDQEYNPYNDTLASGTDDYSTFVKSLKETGSYPPGNAYVLRILRKQRTILKDSFLNNLGLPQRYPNKPYVVANDRFAEAIGNTSFANFYIQPQNFLLETEVEQRNKNALSVISNVLAVWGGLTALYIFLFGADSIKPWGFIQERILKNVMHNKLRTAPFKKEGTPEERIEALETFLKDYVIDVGLIDQLNKLPYKSHEDEEK
ncbi:16548_t:CDS:2 [Entrophospora sp. SA101]|nr:16548_t:CDS:2 [Entrophospora sp. SA101]